MEPNPTPDLSPREVRRQALALQQRGILRDLIAERLRASDAVDMVLFPQATYRALADEVVDLFDLSTERVSEFGDGQWMVVPGECEATHRRYVLRSAPVPVEGTS